MTCIIMRGVPGSGKSYHAKKLAETYAAARTDRTEAMPLVTNIVSADDYHNDEHGKYKFNPANLGAAHLACFIKADVILSEHAGSDSLLIVDNTNLHAWEFSPYVMLAHRHGHKVSSVLVLCNLEDCMKWQTHGVPESKLSQMMRNIESPTPGLEEIVIRNFGPRHPV